VCGEVLCVWGVQRREMGLLFVIEEDKVKGKGTGNGGENGVSEHILPSGVTTETHRGRGKIGCSREGRQRAQHGGEKERVHQKLRRRVGTFLGGGDRTEPVRRWEKKTSGRGGNGGVEHNNANELLKTERK